jgi:glycosyltransferase involved in cell wall biosynthesis/predicted  nucleic acid-binding Zn-ribbon protein
MSESNASRPPVSTDESIASEVDVAHQTLRAALRRVETLNLVRGRLEDVLERETMQHDADVSAVRSELQEAQQRYRVATQNLAESRERLDRAMKQIDALMGTIEGYRGQLASSEREVAETRTKLEGAWSRNASSEDEIRRLRAAMASREAALDDARQQLQRITGSRAWKAVNTYRSVRTALHSTATPQQDRDLAMPEPQPADEPGAEPQTVQSSQDTPTSQLPELAAQYERWKVLARAAAGTHVVFMFSGTTFVQEHRANRPIRLTRVYLGREDPVFFNYYRWGSGDALPAHDNQLLLQSPIDLTPELIDDLLRTDFGNKTKVMFASFPHEIMVKSVAKAQQHGWTVIYDARDDWEEFSKVGAAKWYDMGYERYVARQADIVTAVSWPLARKIEAMSGRPVSVNANAADPDFPKAARPRAAAWPPLVGYFGHLTDKWFDWDLVRLAARRYPDWTFELAGHQAPANLALPDNVKLLGLRSHAELAELSTRWALGIIPFKTGSLADGVDPIKVYEYLQLGLPVLATYFPQMRDYPGVWLAHSHDDFVAKLPDVARAHLDEDAVGTYVAQNTWPERVAQYDRQVAGFRAGDHRGDLREVLRSPA